MAGKSYLHFRSPPRSVSIVYTGKAYDIECSKTRRWEYYWRKYSLQESQRFEHPKINLDGKELKYIKTPQACNCVLVYSLEIAKNLDAVGIEPTTFHMRSENHTPRPSARDSNKILFRYILNFQKYM